MPKQLEEPGIFQGVALNLSQAKPTLKQFNLKGVGDASGSQSQWQITKEKADSSSCLGIRDMRITEC